MQWKRPLPPTGSLRYQVDAAKLLGNGETLTGAAVEPGSPDYGVQVSDVSQTGSVVQCRLSVESASQDLSIFTTTGVRVPIVFTLTTSAGDTIVQTVLVNVKTL